MATTEGIGDKDDRAKALAGVAQALAQVRNQENARKALQKTLVAAEGIGDEDDRAKALAEVAEALALVADAHDQEIAAWTVDAFRQARLRGRDEVWRHIAAFAPVLAKLGVISETWDRIQAVERVVSGERV